MRYIVAESRDAFCFRVGEEVGKEQVVIFR